MEYLGEFFEARSSSSQPAFLCVEDQTLTVYSEDKRCLAKDLVIDNLQDNRQVFFRCGRQFLAKQPFDDEFIRQRSSQSERLMGWLEAFSPIKMLVLAIVFIITLMLFRIGFYQVSDFVASVFPTSWEKTIGENTYSAMQKVIFQPSQLSAQRQQRLRQKTLELIALADLDSTPEIHFHDSPKIGPNAMAFPGGPIVMTDQLVNLMKNDDQIIAVMAHEVMHLKERHSIRQIINITGASVVAMMIFGGDTSSLDELSGIAISAWGFSNSRTFEQQADEGAIQILTKAGYAPNAMVEAIETLTALGCLEKDAQGHCIEDDDSTDWLSTHPSGNKRVQYMRQLIVQQP